MTAGGYRLEGQGSDLAIAVEGPDVGSCLAHAVEGFAAAYVEVDPDTPRDRVPVQIDGADAPDLLLGLLDEALLRLDAYGEVAVGLADATVEGGRLRGSLEVVPVERATLAGAVPKAVTWHNLSLEPVPGDRGWRGRVVVDL